MKEGTKRTELMETQVKILMPCLDYHSSALPHKSREMGPKGGHQALTIGEQWNLPREEKPTNIGKRNRQEVRLRTQWGGKWYVPQMVTSSKAENKSYWPRTCTGRRWVPWEGSYWKLSENEQTQARGGTCVLGVGGGIASCICSYVEYPRYSCHYPHNNLCSLQSTVPHSVTLALGADADGEVLLKWLIARECTGKRSCTRCEIRQSDITAAQERKGHLWLTGVWHLWLRGLWTMT